MTAGTIVGLFLIPSIFYTYTGILGRNYLILDILTFYISVAASFAAAYRLARSGTVYKYRLPLFLAAVIFLTAFIVFTKQPPDIGIFKQS